MPRRELACKISGQRTEGIPARGDDGNQAGCGGGFALPGVPGQRATVKNFVETAQKPWYNQKKGGQKWQRHLTSLRSWMTICSHR